MNNPNLTGTRPTKMRFNRNLLSCALVACLAMSAPAMADSSCSISGVWRCLPRL